MSAIFEILLIVMIGVLIRARMSESRAWARMLAAERANTALFAQHLALTQRQLAATQRVMREIGERADPRARGRPPGRADDADWRRRWALAVLGARGDPSPEDLRKLRSRAIIRAHPDSGGSAEALAEVEEAFAALQGRTP